MSLSAVQNCVCIQTGKKSIKYSDFKRAYVNPHGGSITVELKSGTELTLYGPHTLYEIARSIELIQHAEKGKNGKG